ncbi:sensor domain-containing protein [Gynuella sp.]|uniref:sensor domain-containing protein n=1 Tax=Gynuella sp. TaxID=2969146 RepID=UPI003D0FDA20
MSNRIYHQNHQTVAPKDSHHLYQLERLRQWLSKALIHGKNETSLLMEVCRLVVEVGNYPSCSLIMYTPDQNFERGARYPDSSPAHSEFDHSLYEQALHDLRTYHVIHPEQQTPPASFNKQPVILIPLSDLSSTIFGILEICLPSAEQDLRENSMLKAIADDIACRLSELRQINGYQQQIKRLNTEKKRQGEFLSYLQRIDQITRILQSAGDPQYIMRRALDLILDIFRVSKALLSGPCDPAAKYWSIRVMAHTDEQPPLMKQNSQYPLLEEGVDFFNRLLASQDPVMFGEGSEQPVPSQLQQQYDNPPPISGMAIAVYPLTGEPWTLTIITIGSKRTWSTLDQKIFKEIGRRLSMGLTTWLNYQHLEAREAELQSLVRAIPDLAWQKDREGHFRNCNQELENLFGTSKENIIGRTAADFYPPEQARIFDEEDLWVINQGQPLHIEHWITFTKTGHKGLFELSKNPVFDSRGNVIGLVGIGHDVTERRRAEQELRIAATTFNSQEAIAITDAENRILRVNQAFCDISGYSCEDVVGKTPNLLSSGRHDSAFYDSMWQQLNEFGHWQGEIWNRRKNGEIYPEWLSINVVRDNQGEITNYVGTFLDLTSNKQAEQEIERLAFYDLLTGLPNRRLFMDRLRQAQTNRARSNHNNAVILVDLDNFKVLNDSGSHDIGDQLLVQVAERLQNFIFEGDTAARLGGDEFIVLLEELSDNPHHAASQAKQVAEQIQQLLTLPYTIADQIYHSTPSIGVTMMVSTDEQAEDLVRQADIAMYQAKNAGRNTIRFFDPQMQSVLTQRATLESELRAAVDNGEFQLHYQPQVDSTGIIIGAEALIRWRHPVRGIIYPDQFIPLSEQTGLIELLGQWALEQACRQLMRWSEEDRTQNLILAVNVSARQFHQDNFVEQVSQAISDSGACINRLKLEMTETMILGDVPGAITKMKQLQSMGIGFSLDDFGTGYSSLSYLTQLPLEQVKIDRSFIQSLPHNENNATVVQTIISLTRSLGLKVIAEGVETEAQRQFLNQHGCLHCQGYLFSRPVPIERFEQLLDVHDNHRHG